MISQLDSNVSKSVRDEVRMYICRKCKTLPMEKDKVKDALDPYIMQTISDMIRKHYFLFYGRRIDFWAY